MSRFRKGEHVRATIEGPVTQEALGSLYIDVGNGILTELPVEAPRVSVERLTPAEWPPKPGDLWRDRDGDLWFARALSDDGTASLWTSGNSQKGRAPFGSLSHSRLLAEHGPLSLVHREDERGGEYVPCGCDHHGDHAGCDHQCECGGQP